MMRFVGEAYGIRWTDTGSSGITLRATEHHAVSALIPLKVSRTSDMGRLLDLPLSVQIRSDEYPAITENEIQHQWNRLGLGSYNAPGTDPSTWLRFFGDTLELDVTVPEEAYQRLLCELRAFGAAQSPKFFWGDTGDFELCRGMPFRDASGAYVEAFFKNCLPIWTRSAPSINFVVGTEKHILDSL